MPRTHSADADRRSSCLRHSCAAVGSSTAAQLLVLAARESSRNLVIPAVDSGGHSLTIDLTYEFLLLVASRDHAEETARDSITVPLA